MLLVLRRISITMRLLRAAAIPAAPGFALRRAEMETPSPDVGPTQAFPGILLNWVALARL